jgi:hypothetical protein
MSNGKKKHTPKEKQDSTAINRRGYFRANLRQDAENMVTGATSNPATNYQKYQNSFNQSAKDGKYRNYSKQVSNVDYFQDEGSRAGAEYYNKIGFKNKDINMLDRAASNIRQGVAKFLGKGGRF